MAQTKTDLRVLRTRKLIMDSFINLSRKKEFKDITIKDITEEAMINRATFYYHFHDIYDLLEKALSEVLSVNLSCSYFQEKEFNEEMLTEIFISVTNFQKSLSTRCYRGYEDIIARIIRDQLEVIFSRILEKLLPNEDKKAIGTMAVILSWGIYGASEEWRRNSNKISPEDYIKSAIPLLLNGIQITKEKN